MIPSTILNNQYVRLGITLFVGITIGALFYPTKRIEEKISQQYQQQISQLNQQHATEVSSLNDKYTKSSQDYSALKSQTDQKIASLNLQITAANSSKKTTIYKIVKPDGTVIERVVSESDNSSSSETISQVQAEYQQKISDIQKQDQQVSDQKIADMQKTFDSKEQTYQQTIASYQEQKTVSVNQKRFSLEGGILTNSYYYGHTTMDLWGPMFIGLQGEYKDATNANFGAGLGIRF